jgi:hypothetical protein
VDEGWFRGKGKGWKSVGLAAARSAVDRMDGARLVKYSQKQATGRAKTLYAYEDTSKSNPSGERGPMNYYPPSGYRGGWRRKRATSKIPRQVYSRQSPFPAWMWDLVDAETGHFVKAFKSGAALKSWLERNGYEYTSDTMANPRRGRNPYATDLMSAPWYLVHSDGRIEPRAYQSERSAWDAAFRLGDDIRAVQGTRADMERVIERKYRESGNPRRRRTNPEQSAAALYKSFHGKPSSGYTEVEETIHEHDWLTELGALVSLKIKTPSKVVAELSFRTGCDTKVLLGSSEDGRQLYFVGGDQEIPLAKLKLGGGKWKRDSMLLGELIEITYRTKKSMHKFEPIDYYHKAGEDSGVRPVVLYDQRSKLLSLSGGQYKVRPEGIVN